jgi:hypothetical protein
MIKSIAITTKFIGPSNTRGSRISVKSESKRKIYSWDDSCDVSTNHRLACHAFLRDTIEGECEILSYSDTESGFTFHAAKVGG